MRRPCSMKVTTVRKKKEVNKKQTKKVVNVRLRPKNSINSKFSEVAFGKLPREINARWGGGEGRDAKAWIR